MSDYGIARLGELILNDSASQNEPSDSDKNEIMELVSSLATSLRDGEYCCSPGLTA